MLVEALGLEGRPIKRIVIDADIKDVVRIYIQEYAQTDAIERVVDGLVQWREEVKIDISDKPISVDEKGSVSRWPKLGCEGCFFDQDGARLELSSVILPEAGVEQPVVFVGITQEIEASQSEPDFCAMNLSRPNARKLFEWLGRFLAEKNK